MVVSGLPERNGQLHAREIAGVALDILNNVMNFKVPHDHERQLQIRIGKRFHNAGYLLPFECWDIF